VGNARSFRVTMGYKRVVLGQVCQGPRKPVATTGPSTGATTSANGSTADEWRGRRLCSLERQRIHFSLVGEEPLQFFRDEFRLAVVGGAQVVEPIQRLSPDAGQLASERIEGCLEEQWALAATQQQDVCPD
jgi:hypothetical protein